MKRKEAGEGGFQRPAATLEELQGHVLHVTTSSIFCIYISLGELGCKMEAFPYRGKTVMAILLQLEQRHLLES